MRRVTVLKYNVQEEIGRVVVSLTDQVSLREIIDRLGCRPVIDSLPETGQQMQPVEHAEDGIARLVDAEDDGPSALFGEVFEQTHDTE